MNSKLDKSPYNNIYKLLEDTDTIEDEADTTEYEETNLIIYLPNDIKNIILEYISHDQRMELLIHKYGLRFFINKINKIPRSIFGIKKLYKYGNLLKSLLQKSKKLKNKMNKMNQLGWGLNCLDMKIKPLVNSILNDERDNYSIRQMTNIIITIMNNYKKIYHFKYYEYEYNIIRDNEIITYYRIERVIDYKINKKHYENILKLLIGLI